MACSPACGAAQTYADGISDLQVSETVSLFLHSLCVCIPTKERVAPFMGCLEGELVYRCQMSNNC